MHNNANTQVGMALLIVVGSLVLAILFWQTAVITGLVLLGYGVYNIYSLSQVKSNTSSGWVYFIGGLVLCLYIIWILFLVRNTSYTVTGP